MPGRVWIHCDEGVAPLLHAGTCAAIAQAGFAIGPEPGGIGLLLVGALPSAAALARLRAMPRNSCAIVAFTAAPPRETNAQLIAAGASDILDWQAGIAAQQFIARAQRWHAVDAHLASPAVQGFLAGASASWCSLLRQLVEVALYSDAPVLVTGETGTGKELLAQLVHRLLARGELVVVDCTTLTPELAGSELFGHERGAFTGATGPRDGAFALAHGGVLFLDEVGELPMPLQAQLLRAVQERSYKRVGSSSWQHTAFRLVCATNRDLEEEVAKGRFRADLYYRIAGWRCATPPLRERSDDILPLARHFLAQLAAPMQPGEFDVSVSHYLLTRAYPGNVRELRQVVARLWQRHCGIGPITIGAVPPEERAATEAPWPDQQFECAIRAALDRGLGLARISQAAGDVAIAQVLAQEDDNNQRAAARLGVTDRALQIRRKAWSVSAANQA